MLKFCIALKNLFDECTYKDDVYNLEAFIFKYLCL